MAFSPNIQSWVEGVTVLGDLNWRAWDGVIADVWNVECAQNTRGRYVSVDPRIFVVLGQEGSGGIGVQTTRGVRSGWSNVHHPISYIPPDMWLWTETQDLQGLRHLDLHFDIDALRVRFADYSIDGKICEPRLMFSDERLMGLMRLIAAECEAPSVGNDLYGDSLISALLVALWNLTPVSSRKRGRLPERQLRQLTDFIEGNCFRNIRLQELADLTGLSQDYVGRAFKVSTGLSPHAWQMRARIEKVKHLLDSRNVTLKTAAHTAGFSDQAHLTRVFRQVVGTTPAAWQRNRSF